MSLSYFSPAPRPANERERQRAVDESGILRAPPDPTLHQLVASVAKLLEVPVAGISIIDRDRMWFAARIGIHELEASRAISFCAYAILNPHEPLIIPNAIEDDRFEGNPFVHHGLRFYAGMPVLGKNGLPIGALFGADMKPRQKPVPLTTLARLAHRASQAIAEIESQH
ncbi:MAG TPA: GAF domain-containing protein [Sphingomonas sp.]|nr:GAF domain-containing protein [Sphingomonas sp.]